MKIVIVCDILGKKNNGTSMASYNLINFLKAKGHEVKVICCDLDENENKEGFILLNKINLGPLNKIVKRNGVALPRRDKKVITEAIKGCDIVHIMMPFPVGVTACRIAKKLGKPVTAGFHCQAELISSHLGLMNCKPFNDLIYKLFYKRLYQYCDAVHYPTKFICDVFEKIVGPTKHYIISNGVNEYMVSKECEKPEEFKELVQQHWNNVVYTIESGYFDFLAHPDYCVIKIPDVPEFEENRWKVTEALDKYKMPFEVNTSGYNRIDMQHPCDWMLEELCKRRVPTLLSDDAHSVEMLGQHFERAENLLQKFDCKKRLSLKFLEK